MMLPIILAIEPDRRQAARVAGLAPGHINAEIIVVGSVAAALDTLKTRRPDLVLTPQLFSTRDDATLTARLRELEGDRVELPTLVTPLLASGEVEEADTDDKGSGGLLKRLRKQKSAPPAASSTGCSPAVFAAQITEYLVRLVAERHDHEQARRKNELADARGSASAPMLGELLPMPAVKQSAQSASIEAAAYAAFDVDSDAPVSVTAHLPEEDAPAYVPEEETFAIEAHEMELGTQHLEQPESEPIHEPAVVEPVRPEPVVELPEPIVELVAQPSDQAPDDVAANLLADGAADSDDTPEVIEPVEESTEVELAPQAPLDDLASILEDLELEAEFSDEAPQPAEPEPDAIELPAPDELWAQLQTAQQSIAPIEGPDLKKRRPPAPPKTPKSVRAKSKLTAVPKPVRTARPKKPKKPMQDEWGLYDPEQCGFAALLERLEELTEAEADEKEGEGRSAIMRR